MRNLLISCAPLAILLPTAALADTANEDEQSAQTAASETDSSIVVSAKSLEDTLPQELSRYGYRVETVSEERIANRGYVDATQVLDYEVPGLTLTPQAGAFSYANIALQGSRSGDVLWTIDGVRIGNRLYNSTSPADTLPASMISRVEVLKGGHGLFYGTQAVAGVINLVTTPLTDKTGGEVSIGVNSQNGYRADGRVNFSLGDHRFLVWSSKDKADGYEIFDKVQPSVTDKKRGYDVFSSGIKYGYALASDLDFNLQYIRTKADLDNPSVNGKSINARHQQIVIGKLDYTPSEAAAFFLKSYYHQWDTDYGRPGEPTEYWGFKDFGINALAQLKPHKGLEYHVGYEFQNYKGRDESLLIAGETEQVHAVFGQIRTSDDFSKRLRLAAGIRHNEGRASSSTVWSASGVFIVSEALQFDGSVGTSFLLPDAQQLYGVDECCARGNPELLPEESFAINFGASGRIHGLRWNLAGWDRTIENLITTDRTNPPEGFTGIFVNIDGKVKARGFEASLVSPIGRDFSASASYTFSEEKARNTNTQIEGRPKHSGKASVTWEPDAPYGAGLSAKYFGQTYSTLAGFGRQAYGDYAVVDVSAFTFLDRNARNWRLGARIENLFDADYATSLSSAVLAGSNPATRFMAQRLGQPRTFYANLTYVFGER